MPQTPSSGSRPATPRRKPPPAPRPGGMIGQWLGAHASERIERLVLCNTAAKLPSEPWAERIAKIRAAGMAAMVDTLMQRWFTPPYLARADENLASIRTAFLAVDENGYVGCCAAIRDADFRAVLASVSAPALVLTGAQDLSAPKEFGEALADAIPGAARVELPFGHIPMPE